jgi:hypothetical protein
VFFSPDAEDYLTFTQAVMSFKGVPDYLSRCPERQRKIFEEMQKSTDNVLDESYFSQVPFKLGDMAVKYSARPVSAATAVPADSSPHFLRNRMAAHLQQADAIFDFLLQVQKDPEAMPVEDSTVEWDEALSEFIPVATITISKQEVGECEELSFNPWHALPEHAPLGPMNRMRKAIYERAAAIRRGPKTQHPLTAVMTLKDPSAERELLEILKRSGLAVGLALNRLGFVHSARFVFLRDEIGGEKVTRFAIITTYDFDFRDYMNVFIDELGEVFDEMLQVMQNHPSAAIPSGPVRQHREEFIRYVEAVNLTPVLFYSAYPDLSVQNILMMEKDHE